MRFVGLAGISERLVDPFDSEIELPFDELRPMGPGDHGTPP